MAKNKAPKTTTATLPEASTAARNTASKRGGKQGGSFWQQHRLPLLALVALSVLLYLYSATFDYALDDMIYITANQFTKKGFAGIWDIFSQESFVGFWGVKKDLLAGARYRPLSIATYAIEHSLWGDVPQISHLINVLLYALLAVLLYRLLVRIVGSYTPQGWAWYVSLPFVATALYMAHPLHVEWVANIKGRMEMLTIIFALGSMYYSFKYLDTKQMKYVGISLLLFVLGLFTKENGLTLVGIIPLTVYYFERKATTADYLRIVAPLLAGTVVFLLIRRAVIGYVLGSPVIDNTELLNDPFLGASVGDKFATIFYTMGLYIKLLVLPFFLTHDYYPKQIPIISWTDVRAIGSLLLYVAMGAYALWGLVRRNVPSYCIWFYLLSFSLVSNLIFPIGTFMNDRFMDLPSVGYCLLLAYGLVVWLPQRLPNAATARSIVTYGFAGILAFYSVRTLARVPAWRNNETLFLTDVKLSTNSTKVLTSAGGTLLDVSLPKTQDPKERHQIITQAIDYLQRALLIYPTNANALMLLGNAYLNPETRDIAKTLQAYKTILSVNPQNEKVAQNISMISEGNLSPAETDQIIDFLQNTVLPATPDNFLANNTLGVLYGKKKNDLDNAIRYFTEALKYQKDLGTMQDLGVAYGMKRDFASALAINQQALALAPTNPQILRNLGITYQNLGDAAKAQTYFDQAATYAPAAPPANK